MKISDFHPAELKTLLGNRGLRLRTGPFVTHLRSRIPSVAESLRLLYADFPVEENNGLADFHVRLLRPRGLRRYVRPQALFDFDGVQPFAPMPLRLSVPLLEWGLNWCIAGQSHQYLMIHSAVLERGGSAILLPGSPGAGKSTVCAALAWRGWRLLTDELALIRPRDGHILPLPRPVSLKDDSIEVIRRVAPEAVLGPLWPDTKKGTIAHMRPPADAVARADETAQPAWVVFVKYRAGEPAVLEPLSRARAFLRMAENSFNYSILGAQGFETLASVIDSATCFDLTYGNLTEAVDLINSKFK